MAHSSYLDGGQVATSHLARATVLQRSAVAAVGRPPVAFLSFPAISVYDTSEAIFRRSQLSMSSTPLPSPPFPLLRTEELPPQVLFTVI